MVCFCLRKHFSSEDGNQVCSTSSVDKRETSVESREGLNHVHMRAFPRLRKARQYPPAHTGASEAQPGRGEPCRPEN